jgi:hypothetical protein
MVYSHPLNSPVIRSELPCWPAPSLTVESGAEYACTLTHVFLVTLVTVCILLLVVGILTVIREQMAQLPTPASMIINFTTIFYFLRAMLCIT